MIADEKPDTFTGDYNEPGGPYEELGIDQADGYAISADQSVPFSNCHGQNIVSASDTVNLLFYHFHEEQNIPVYITAS